MDEYSEEKISAGNRPKRKYRHFKRSGEKRKFFLVMPYSLWPDKKQKVAKYADMCQSLGYHVQRDTFGSSDQFAVYAWNQDNTNLPQIADISSLLNEQDIERYDWQGKHFPLAKDLALYYIGLLREIVRGKPISREKAIQEYAMKSTGIELSGDTIKGLYHWHQRDSQKGPFFWMGFDGRLSFWRSMPTDRAMSELDKIKARIERLSGPLEEMPPFEATHPLKEIKYREFPSFNKQDFAAFEKRKQSDRRYNNVRKEIWEKMKLAQESIGLELDARDIQLNSRLSRFFPNLYNKFRVTGIWLGYSDASSRYFEKPHLSFGIYKGFLLAGLVINAIAAKELLRVASLVENEPQWFLQLFRTLESEHRVVWYGNVEIQGEPTPGQLSELSTEIRNEDEWLSIGVAYWPDECPKCCEGMAERIADVFEDIMPLYDFTWGKTDGIIARLPSETGDEWDEGEEADDSDLVVESRGGKSLRKRSHSRLSRLFRKWIRDNYTDKIRKETKGIDVEFRLGTKAVCAELKTESEGSTQYMIRSAVGQMLEYNLYPPRKSADEWMIVLDTRPLRKDKQYIDKLRAFFPKPLYLCWLEKNTFKCYPDWPKQE